MFITNEKVQKRARIFFPENFDVTSWEKIKKELDLLESSVFSSVSDIFTYLEKYSEFSNMLSEEIAWRYIKMTCHADNEEYEENYNEYIKNIISKIKPYEFKLKKKFFDSPLSKELKGDRFDHLKKIISNDISLFREENIELQTKETELCNKYGSIYSKMVVTFAGEEKTMAQLELYLKSDDRKIREKAWRLKQERLGKDINELDKLFDDLKHLRVEQAKNAGFDNYRDYKHCELGRFSYDPQALEIFHGAVEKQVIPFLRELNEERRKILKLESLKPWDTKVDLDGRTLKPFKSSEDFINKTIKILNRIKPDYGVNLNKMYNTGLLDLENRKGKAPGGYNYTLEELGASFIFMNAVGLHSDAVTLIHEAGHAMHSFATSKIPVSFFREFPSEIAELASMAMEMLSMDFWDEFYQNSDDLKKARRDQLEGALKFLPWCMIVDSFQHWIYTNPEHTALERATEFSRIMDRFNAGIDWTDLEKEKMYTWMLQLHIFEDPFYYIEYGMSQLGALTIYKNFKEKGGSVLNQYQDFLDSGYLKPVNELYETAGIKFDFSRENLSFLVDFVKKELKNL